MDIESDDPAERLREVLRRIGSALDLNARVDVEEEDDTLYGDYVGRDLGIVIGRQGATIDAIGHVAQRIAYKGTDVERKRVIVDADNYRDRRADELEDEAEMAAVRATRTGKPVSMPAMSASERRIVHEYLRDRGGVETHSEGDEPRRHVVIEANA